MQLATCTHCQKPISFVQWIMFLMTAYIPCQACGFRNKLKPWVRIAYVWLFALALGYGFILGLQNAAPRTKSYMDVLVIVVIGVLFVVVTYVLNPLQSTKEGTMQLLINDELVSETAQADQLQQALNRFWHDQSALTLQHSDGRMLHAIHTGPDLATLQVWDAAQNEQAYLDVQRWRVDTAFMRYFEGASDWHTDLAVAPSQNLFVPPARNFQVKPWMIIVVIVIVVLLIFV